MTKRENSGGEINEAGRRWMAAADDRRGIDFATDYRATHNIIMWGEMCLCVCVCVCVCINTLTASHCLTSSLDFNAWELVTSQENSLGGGRRKRKRKWKWKRNRQEERKEERK